MKKTIISITLVSGVDVLGVQCPDSKVADSVLIQNPQQYNVMGNNFIPLAATLKCDNRIVSIPAHAIIATGSPLPFFDDAYRQTFPEMFVDDSKLVAAVKARADAIDSPVHGKVAKKSSLIK